VSIPQVEKKILEEIQSIVEGETPTWEEIGRLKYCTMVTKEALRMFSPASMFMRKLGKDTKVGGYTLPKGV
jgi:cytochrome P450